MARRLYLLKADHIDHIDRLRDDLMMYPGFDKIVCSITIYMDNIADIYIAIPGHLTPVQELLIDKTVALYGLVCGQVTDRQLHGYNHHHLIWVNAKDANNPLVDRTSSVLRSLAEYLAHRFQELRFGSGYVVYIISTNEPLFTKKIKLYGEIIEAASGSHIPYVKSLD